MVSTNHEQANGLLQHFSALLKQRGFVWLCCELIRRLLYFFMADKEAAQRVLAVVLNCTHY